jgi:hypothetical protein
MTEPARNSDAGFVLLDALLATALAAFAGGIILSVSSSMSTRQGRELDRSVALVMSQTLMRQYILLGDAAIEREDELYRYAIVPAGHVAGTSLLRAMAVVAVAKGGGQPLRLDFLAAAP